MCYFPNELRQHTQSKYQETSQQRHKSAQVKKFTCPHISYEVMCRGGGTDAITRVGTTQQTMHQFLAGQHMS